MTNPPLTGLLLPCADGCLFVVLPRRALWDHPKRKQPIPRRSTSSLHPTHRRPIQLRRRISQRKNLKWKKIVGEIALYAFITSGIRCQYFFHYDKIRQLEPGHSDTILWKIPSVKFVFDSAKVSRLSSASFIEPATSFSSPISEPSPMTTASWLISTPMVLGPQLRKMTQSYSPCSLVTTTN